ncbi:hypothetical protein ALC62_13063 [Cyphomyrmex costatus]|uniref:Uncharacterized protein n=1 Tax=Cyphomyrmex costatus TaxID=456900 RepID=A0A151IAI1_9HYME|nr:hypothetical protein ALC62_13063 [Cyphomyrmex costatus]
MLIAPENETVSPPINEIDYSSCISSPVFRLRQEDKCSPTRNEPSFRLSKSCNSDRHPWFTSSREFTKPNSRCRNTRAPKSVLRHSWRCTIGGQASRPSPCEVEPSRAPAVQIDNTPREHVRV